MSTPANQRAPRRQGRWALLLCAAAFAATPAEAQYTGQPLPGQGGYELNAALNRLAANPRDVEALLAAGMAALALGDAEAAMGFLGRADQLHPGHPRIKASLASAMVRNQNPYDAIQLFADAERAGASDAMLAGDRGLAYDLVGDNATAQRYYRQALARGASDEIARRLALSLAIAGDRRGFEAALSPQIQRQNPAAWRTRAFALAILGDANEATRIAYSTMRRDLADGIVAYLRYMPRLTRAQQAAAANFGHFPRAAQIGRDDPRAARFASAAPRAAPSTAATPRRGRRGADSRLIPAGEPLGRSRRGAAVQADADRARRGRSSGVAATTRPLPRAASAARPVVAAAPAPARRPFPVAPPPRVATATPRPLPAAAPPPAALPGAAQRPASPPFVGANPAPVVGNSSTGFPGSAPVTASQPSPAASTAPLVAQPPAGAPLAAPAGPVPLAPVPLAPPVPTAGVPGGFMGPVLAPEASATPPAAPMTSAAASTAASPSAAAATGSPAAAPRPGVSEAFSGFRPPPGEQGASTQADPAGAGTGAGVNPAALSHPSRIWVQLATGQDRAALGFNWQRMAIDEAELFRTREPWIAPGAQGNRLLVGPFASEADAQAVVNALAQKQRPGSVWTSPAGQPVDPLTGR